jgi:hypothetical protein
VLFESIKWDCYRLILEICNPNKKLTVNINDEEPSKTMRKTLALISSKTVPDNENNNNSFLPNKLEVFTSLQYFF